MRIPDSVVAPGDTPPDTIGAARVFIVRIVDEPVVILLPAFVVQLVGQHGELVAADAHHAALRANGAQPMTTLSFGAEPTPGWVTTIDTCTTTAQIIGPATLGEVYSGSLPPLAPAWIEPVVENPRRGLILISASGAGSLDEALDLIGAGRASWVRTAVELVAEPRGERGSAEPHVAGTPAARDGGCDGDQ